MTIEEQIERLKAKYKGDTLSYLKGLEHSNGVNYTQYIQTEALLALQIPRTPIADELVFIAYHQITELYFKLIKNEIKQLSDPKEKEYLAVDKWKIRLKRLINYIEILIHSFPRVVGENIDKNQFNKFRLALMPASGFQSAQYRHLEFMSTDLDNLIHPKKRKSGLETTLEKYENIYWKKGAVEIETGKKVPTLTRFEAEHDKAFLELIEKYKTRNLNYLYRNLSTEMIADESLKKLLYEFDRNLNFVWKNVHLEAIKKQMPESKKGTGGTNWKEYLPPKNQQIHFFPDLSKHQ